MAEIEDNVLIKVFENDITNGTYIIPEGVTSIGYQAFRECYNLQKISIPEGVTSIGDSAFYYCINLQEISIPKGVISIGKYTFCNCTNLQEINIPEGVINIGHSAFCGCDNLQKISLPKTLDDDSLENVYRDTQKFDLRLMFGDDLERFEKLKEKANFDLSSDYDGTEMGIFYHRMIRSIGIEEIERIVEIPNLTEKEIIDYQLDKDEAFQSLYETKYKIQGDLGITLDIFKHINFGKYKSDKNEKNNAEMKIFKQLNKILEEGEHKTTLGEIISEGITDVGYKPQELEKIEELENRINRKLIKENLEKIKPELENSLTQTDIDQGEAIVQAQVEPIRIMVEDVITKSFIEKGRLEVEELRKSIEEKIASAGAPYIYQNKASIVERVMKVIQKEETMKTLNHSALEAIKSTKQRNRRSMEIQNKSSITKYRLYNR